MNGVQIMYKLFSTVDFICFIAIYFIHFFPKWKNDRRGLLEETIFYIYIVFVFYFTLMPFIIPIPYINTNYTFWNLNLIPFNDFLQGHGGALKELILNITMMMPFGILIPFVYRKNFNITIKYTFIFSFLIEIFQLLSVRKLNSCDITDLISNTLGGILGYLIYLIFNKLVRKILNKVFKNNNIKSEFVKKISNKERIIIKIIVIQLIIRSIMIIYI